MSTGASQEERVITQPYLCVKDGNWQPDTDYYAPFIQEVTGVSVSDDLSNHDCYRIGNRIQGFIEKMKRDGDWNCEEIASYPVVESTEEVFCISEFFRDCHEREMCA